MVSTRTVPILSFFTGGGLMDIGLNTAGFNVVWTNEGNPEIADLYEYAMTELRRSANQRAVAARISSRQCVTKLKMAAVRRAAFPSGAPNLFGVVGGPPCPDFSSGGLHGGGNGINGRLTKTFVEHICRLRPGFFLIENVSGLYKFEKHRRFLLKQIKYLEDAGNFATDYALLNALELGVPQSRERLFVVGFKKSLANRAVGRRLKAGERDWFPWPLVEQYRGACQWRWPTSCRFGYTPVQPTHLPQELMVYPLLNGRNDPEKLPNGLDIFEPYSQKFYERREGDVSNKSFKRLHRFRFSPTAWYGNREVHLHPWKPRRLSVREALRIQTAPDDYVLPEGATLSAKFTLIGNGVPCRMAEHIGLSLMEFIRAGTD